MSDLTPPPRGRSLAFRRAVRLTRFGRLFPIRAVRRRVTQATSPQLTKRSIGKKVQVWIMSQVSDIRPQRVDGPAAWATTLRAPVGLLAQTTTKQIKID